MNVYPLESIDIEEAKEKQFKIVDIITKHFRGSEILTRGDLGVIKGINKPSFTLKAENIISEFFNAEKSVLVRGAGTAAIKWGLYGLLKDKNRRNILIHKAPIYPTTEVTFNLMNIETIESDFNDLSQIENTLKNNNIDIALIQHTRQKIGDSYNIKDVIDKIKEYSIPIITDDNYAVMKTKNIGIELGANLSAFSTFKLLGPEGIGCLVGNKKYIDKVIEANYSGGCQVQGYEALEVLKGFIYAPVSLAIQSEVNNKLFNILNSGEIEFIKSAYIVNAQSKVIVIEFKEDIAKEILLYSEKLGALPNPVGAESKYEFSPLFYKVSGTFIKSDNTLENRMIRINPNRAGVDTVLRILKDSYKLLKGNK
ncbi:aminotransferase class V-fold PLP-dependent enzyme [Brachyspira aalborgi]|uniref:aminotransferase class V-fold PLP-dependent enzyme n=1 Tax=Brachyspira aalborgi TaxID=29522 RepID=UPI00266670AA|nr:aminotransferase class V-fold PLP-dependent enzyme [Brachyspira aalborgi]